MKKFLMRIINALYIIASYVLFAIGMFLIGAAILSKLLIGQVLDFNQAEFRGVGYEKYFEVLIMLEDWFFKIALLWIILAFAEGIMQNLTIKAIYTKLGIVGLVVFIAYLYLDPFGYIKYLVD